jgi:phage I-like protein
MKILIVPPLLRALNAEDPREVLALNFELAAGVEPPTDLVLIPGGATVTGRDGRSWTNPSPQSVVEYFTARGVDLPMDIEHATELRAPQGEAAPAVAWIKGLEVKDGGAVHGRIEWTPKGREMVMNREYRYYSPVLIYEKATGIIRGLSSVGLTNKPNLNVTALNHEQQKENSMLLKLLAALGLPATTTEEAALNHVTTLRTDYATALNRAESPDLTKFVPKAQFDAAVTTANNAQKELKELKASETEKAINAEIDAALKAGKIVPATVETYTALCRQEGGLAQFKNLMAVAPVIADNSNLDNKQIDQTTALNAEQLKVAEMFGNSADDLKKYGAA